MPNTLNGYTSEVINPKHNAFSIIWSPRWFRAPTKYGQFVLFIGPFVVLGRTKKIYDHQKYFKLTNKG